MAVSPLNAQIPVRTIRAEKEGDGPHYNGEDLYFISDNLLKSAFFYKGESVMLIPPLPFQAAESNALLELLRFRPQPR
jgi:hypothetical protein